MTTVRELTNTSKDTAIGFTTMAGFELAQRAAKLLASSTLVPKAYQNNLPNCVVALNMANRIGADPLMTMQNLYIVHGTPAWSAQFMIAAWNQCDRYTSIRYEFFGDNGKDSWGCRARSTERATGTEIIGSDVTIAIAKKEGWFNRNGSKWQTMPQQMLMYRAAAWLVRANAPELTMGLKTVEEVGDIYEAEQTGSGYEVIQEINEQINTETGEVIETKTYAEIMHAIQHAKDRKAVLAANEEVMAFNGPEDQKQELVDAVVKVAESMGIENLSPF